MRALAFATLLLMPMAIGKDARGRENPSIPDLASRALKSVVLVVTADASGKELRQGSGFFVSSDGALVTNNHVIEGCASAVVKKSDGAFFLVDGIMAADEPHDLALLKVSGKEFAALSISQTDDVKIGEPVLAVGSPLALEGTVSTGIVSGIREQGDASLLQTTAPISPGSSGGALLNNRGEVIGVTTSQFRTGQNLNFAMPAKLVRSLIMSAKTVRRFSTTTASDSQARPQDIPLRWRHLQDNSEWNIRVDGDYVYEEAVLSESVRNEGGFALCEVKKSGSNWVGTCRARIPFRCGRSWHWCTLESQETLTSVTTTRIEGESVTFGPGALDCETCKATVWVAKHFSLMPSKP